MPVIRQRRSVAALLSALIVLALSINAMAGVFCAHGFGLRNCCPSTSSQHKHDEDGSVPAEAGHEDMDMSSDMSDDQMDDANASTTEYDIHLAGANLQTAFTEQNNGEAITQPNEPCSHCMMHSQSSSNSSLKVAVQNAPSYEVIAADGSTDLIIPSSPSQTFLELHDHGPPGSSPPLYILVSSFRI